MITKKRFYLLSLWLPLVVPVLFGLLCLIPGIKWFFVLPAIIGAGALLYGGAQYAVLMPLLYHFYLRHKTGDELQRLSWLLPVVYMPFAALCYTAVAMTGHMPAVAPNLGSAAGGVWIIYFVVGIPTAYVYVLLVHGLYKLLAWRKVVTNTQEIE